MNDIFLTCRHKATLIPVFCYYVAQLRILKLVVECQTQHKALAGTRQDILNAGLPILCLPPNGDVLSHTLGIEAPFMEPTIYIFACICEGSVRMS